MNLNKIQFDGREYVIKSAYDEAILNLRIAVIALESYDGSGSVYFSELVKETLFHISDQATAHQEGANEDENEI